MTGARMNDDELAAIQARANAATPGPWEFRPFQAVGGPAADVLMPLGDGCQTGLTRSALLGTQDAQDAEFIAHARTDVPALLAEVRRLAAEVAVKDAALTRVKALALGLVADIHRVALDPDAECEGSDDCAICTLGHRAEVVRTALGGVGDHTTTDDEPPPP